MDVDYISELPADLKEKILVKLPIKEAVRTSILSSKWKDSWISIPTLVFEEHFSVSRLIRLVDNVLIFHHGPILEFELVSEHSCNNAISRWMLILSRNGIREIDLTFHENGCIIPSRLFSCLALERLELSGCIINVPRFFQGFKLLHTLWLSHFDLSGSTVGNLVSSCPLLEILVLCVFVMQGCLHILAPNLRRLDIYGQFDDLCLDTPKLAWGSIFLTGNGDYRQFSVAKAGKQSNIKQTIGCLNNIRELDIGSAFLDYLAMGPIPKNLPKIFNHLTELSVRICSYDQNQIATALWLFQNALNLRVLHIRFLDFQGEDISKVQTLWKLKATDACLFERLEIVNVGYDQMIDSSFRWTKSMLKFAKLVLSTAPVLEKLNIIYFGYAMLFRAKLEGFPKLSKKAEIAVVNR